MHLEPPPPVKQFAIPNGIIQNAVSGQSLQPNYRQQQTHLESLPRSVLVRGASVSGGIFRSLSVVRTADVKWTSGPGPGRRRLNRSSSLSSIVREGSFRIEDVAQAPSPAIHSLFGFTNPYLDINTPGSQDAILPAPDELPPLPLVPPLAHNTSGLARSLSRAISKRRTRRGSIYEVYEKAKVRGAKIKRQKWTQLAFEYTIYTLLLCFIYFVLVGMPLWRGAVWWLFYAVEEKMIVSGGYTIMIGVAALYTYAPLVILFEPGYPPVERPTGTDQSVRETALLIPCYKAANIIGPTLEAAVKIFPPQNIFVIANGNSPQPLDNTEDICKPYGVNHIWSPVGSKIVAQFVGCYAAKHFKNVLLIDDDCALPPNFPIVGDRLRDKVMCIGYTIKSVGPDSSRGTLCQQAQDLEYKISGLQRALAGKLGSATFPHGAISLWDRIFLVQTFHDHVGFSVSEDWFMGHSCRRLGGRIQMCTSVFVETETPVNLAPIHKCKHRTKDQCCCLELDRFTDVSVRRWLRSRFTDRPYKAPFELVSQSRSERTYRAEFKRCVCFWLRVWRLPRAVSRSITGRTFSTHQRRMLEELWLDSCWTSCDDEDENADNAGGESPFWLREASLGSGLGYGEGGPQGVKEEEEEDNGSEFSESEDTASDAPYGESSSDEEDGSDSQWYGGSGNRNSGHDGPEPGSHTAPSGETDDSCDPSVDTVLRFCYEMVTEHFEDGMASSTLLVYFSAVRGVSGQEGNEYLGPARYTPILSRLIYCTRLIFLEAILPLRTYTSAGFAARPRYGHLSALNAVRVDQMCDGTMSPLGEFLSPLAYGLTLQRSEGPTWHFDWSDDGQTISWDGDTRLSMGQFRSLAHEAFRQATVQARRLMYDSEPEDPKMGSLRDRLSSTTPGYSFLTDPQNKLGELYLTVFMRACIAPVDGLLHRRHGESHGSWDVDAAHAYLHGHDAFLKNLMVLEQLDSGQAARVSELLILEHMNTRSRLRGIGIFGGQMFSITRHNKARLTTNREFQVARFFSPQVATLMYRYLVYIRPTAYAILRQCFRHEPVRTLIFTPASKGTGWTTKVFTEELKRLSRDALGTEMEIGVRLYRQLSIAITERHVRGALPTFDRFDDVTEAGDPDVAFAWQSGHPMQRHSTYGLDGAFPDKLQPSLLRLYARCSGKWHSFLMIGPEAPPADDSPSVRSDADTILSRQDSGQALNAKKRKPISISSPRTPSQTSRKRQRRGSSNTAGTETLLSNPSSSQRPCTLPEDRRVINPSRPQPLAAIGAGNSGIDSDKGKFQSYGTLVHLTEFNILVCYDLEAPIKLEADEVVALLDSLEKENA